MKTESWEAPEISEKYWRKIRVGFVQIFWVTNSLFQYIFWFWIYKNSEICFNLMFFFCWKWDFWLCKNFIVILSEVQEYLLISLKKLLPFLRVKSFECPSSSPWRQAWRCCDCISTARQYIQVSERRSKSNQVLSQGAWHL